MRPLLCLLTMTALLFGCGGPPVPETGEVSGCVTIDGKPAVGIRVRFTPVGKGRASTGTTDDDGCFSLIYSANATGALIGEHKVTISNQEPSVDVPEPGAKASPPQSSIPRKYAEVTKDVEVQSGSNKIDLAFP